jgi:adenylate cyclase
LELKEIERKFLVLNDSFKKDAFKKEKIIQGFLSSVPERTVRVRLTDLKGFLTVKGLGNATGTTRFEWEKEISDMEAQALLKLCEPGVIEKTRYYVKESNHLFEIDQFELENEGLVVAEIELQSEDESFVKPVWLGQEVTGDVKYYNASLIKNPYRQW